MKLTVRAIILSAAVVLSSTALGAQSPSILERREGPPLWISAEAVADSEKIVNLDLLDSLSLRRLVERQRRELGDSIAAGKSGGDKPSITLISPSDCVITTSQACDERPGSNSNLSDLATYSLSITRGMIRTVEPGFAYSEPAVLLGVEVSEVVQGATPISPFYIAYRVARFQIGPYHFCNANKGFEPQPGDQVLLFDYWGPAGRDDVLYSPRFEHLFFQSRKGTLYIPPRLRGTPRLESVRTLDEIVGRLRSEVSRLSRGSVR